MTTTKDNHVKILFRFYSDFLEEETVETMWATIVGNDKGLYKLDNIPFYAQLVASGDTVFAEYDEKEKMLTFREIIEYSGNSTIQVVIMDNSKDINTFQNGTDLGYDEIYTYIYDKNDSLIEKKQPSFTIAILYKDGKLLEEKKTYSYGQATLTKKFNDFNKCEEAIFNEPSDEKLNFKIKYEYNGTMMLLKRQNIII